jgi:hypothetical protein
MRARLCISLYNFRTSSGTSAGDFTVFEDTVFSATLRSIIRLVGLRDRAFEPVDSVTEEIDDIGRSMSSLPMYSPSDALGVGVHSGIFASCRAGVGTGGVA